MTKSNEIKKLSEIIQAVQERIEEAVYQGTLRALQKHATDKQLALERKNAAVNAALKAFFDENAM